MTWYMKCLLSVVLFVIGTLCLKACMSRGLSSITCTLVLGVIYGILAISWLFYDKKHMKTLSSIDRITCGLLIGFAIMYFVASMIYFTAINEASNPGYARALMSFEVIGLVVLSSLFLRSKVEMIKVVGTMLVIVGSVLVVI